MASFITNLQKQADDLIQKAKDQAFGNSSSSQPGDASLTTPWDKNPNNQFYPNTPIDPARWDKLFPYKLVVINAETNRIVEGNSDGGGIQLVPESGTTGPVVITANMPSTKWEYTFPITPQQMSTTSRFAITVTPTQQGVTEEHGGIYFKDITISGTTGVFPQRPLTGTDTRSNSGFSISQFVASTTQAFDQLASAARNFASSVGISSATKKAKPTDSQLYSTGYFQALYLGRFLEQYALMKKSADKAYWRLVFVNQKDNEAYVVTPISFNLGRSVSNPMEYTYTLQMRAWRRTSLETSAEVGVNDSLGINNSGFLARANQILSNSRLLLSSSQNLIRAVRSDFRRPFEILRQTAVLVKNLSGEVQTAADLPSAIIRDARGLLAESLNELKRANNINRRTANDITSGKKERQINDLIGTSLQNEGVSFSSSGAPYGKAVDQDPAFNPFSNPEANFDLLNDISLDTISLNSQLSEALSVDQENIARLTVADLRSYSAEIQQLAIDIANQFGAGDSTAYDVLGLSAPKERSVDMSIDELQILEALYDVRSVFDALTVTTDVDDDNILNPIQFTRDLANENGITFNDSPSKVLVPVPFGLSIEQIALRYLGDAERWVEIATINSLREPYIDETGFTLNLLSNGEGRQFTVPRDNRLYVGQKIILKDNNTPMFSRNIINIEEIGATTLLITVDGQPNLDILQTAQGANIRAYLAGTVNSQDQIFIPVELDAVSQENILPPPVFREDPLVKLSKVDVLVGEDGDIKLDPLGDFRLSAGLTNLLQALRIMFSTTQGDVMSDPNFGVGIKVGTSTADIDLAKLVKQIKSQVESDPRYSRVASLKITVNGPELAINMSVEIAGDNGVVPINFVLRK